MKRIPWVLIIIAALTLANIWMTREQAMKLSQIAELRTEKDQLAAQVEDLNMELRKLKTSHELYILVTEDMDKRLAREEGRTGP